jgi:outer membrane protein assembly factor BamB
MAGTRRVGLIAIIIVALALAGFIFGQRSSTAQSPPPRSDGTWPMYQYGAAHNAVFDQPALRADYQSALGDRINGGFAIDGTTLYAVSFDRKLYALDAPTGKIRWSVATDDMLMSTPVFAKGIIIVGSGHNGFLKPDDPVSQTWGRPEGNTVFAFAADGKLVWKFHTDGEDMPTPAIDGDTVIFGNGDAHAYALDLATGKQKWQIPLAGAVTMASTTIDGGVAFISSCHNAPYVCETRALDVRNGHTLWTNPNGGSDCAPAVADGLVFVNGNRNDEVRFHTGGSDVVAAIDERTGQTRWTYESEPGPYTFPATNERQIAGTVVDGVLYQPIGNASRMIAFEASSGKILWNLRTWANVKMSPVVAQGRLYFGDISGILYAVDAKDGTVIHTSSFLQPFSSAPPLIVGDTIFVAVGPIIVATPLENV